MTALSAVKVINRRLTTIAKLFGSESDIFTALSAGISDFKVYTNPSGILQLSASKTNLKEYRRIVAMAKRIQKTPYSVLKRKADKRNEELKNDSFVDIENEGFSDIETYNRFLESCKDYWYSCYVMAEYEGYNGYAIYERADELFNNRPEYIRTWNKLYKQGEFDEFKKDYEHEQFEQEYDIDEETGEVIPKSDFYKDI